jgi:hypothetical protein
MAVLMRQINEPIPPVRSLVSGVDPAPELDRAAAREGPGMVWWGGGRGTVGERWSRLRGSVLRSSARGVYAARRLALGRARWAVVVWAAGLVSVPVVAARPAG